MIETANLAMTAEGEWRSIQVNFSADAQVRWAHCILHADPVLGAVTVRDGVGLHAGGDRAEQLKAATVPQ
jgi:hypothetical protein